MLHVLKRVPQKPTQDENDSNRRKEAISSVRDDDYPSHGSHFSPVRCSKGQKGCGKDHRLGELLHNPEERENVDRQGAGERVAATNTR